MPQAILTLHCRFADMEPLVEKLWEHGTLGLQEIELEGGRYEIQAYFEQPFEAADWHGFVRWSDASAIGPDDWRASWQPIEVGEKLWLAPHWTVGETPHGRVRVNIHPGQGSGTSYSEPTLLMLEILEQVIQPDDVVTDIGTGSGILTAAAYALGARRLLACDVDGTAAAQAHQTLASDGIHAGIWCGSPRSMATGHATLVLANVNAIQLEAIAPELIRIGTANSRLLVGGFTERSLARIEAAFAGEHRTFSWGPWRALLYNSV